MAGDEGVARIRVEADTAEATRKVQELRRAMEGPVAYSPVDALKGFTASRKFMAAIVFGALAYLNTFLQAKVGVALSPEVVELVGQILLVAVGAEGGRDMVNAWRAKGVLAEAATAAPAAAPPAGGQ